VTDFKHLTVEEFLQAVAAKSPTPGGGAVASVTAALAAALAQMVVQYSIGKKSLAAHDEIHKAGLERLKNDLIAALDLAEEDAKAYGELNELWKLDQNDPRRKREFPGAVQRAIAAPRRVLDLSLTMLNTMRSLMGLTNSMLASDLAIAAVLADAAARAAAWNMRINLPLLADESQRADVGRFIDTSMASAHALCDQIESGCRST
jgi:formiminotetrahydrofolate cyclodeaminase